MDERDVPIDPDAFIVHKDPKYLQEVGEIMKKNNFFADLEKQNSFNKKL
jgi:hypothetical protein